MRCEVLLEQVEVSDAAGFAEFHRVLTSAEAAGRDFHTPTGLEEMRVGYAPDNTAWRSVAVVARLDRQLVGAMNLEQPLLDNTHLVEVQIAVLPEHRRRGVGRALFDHAVEFTRSASRRSIWAETASPVETSGAGAAFAAACGMSRQHVEMHQVLALPVPGELLAAVDAVSAEAGSAGYRIETWQDRCPDEWAEGYCRLLTVFVDHAPTGDLDVEGQTWDLDRLRATEDRRIAQGRSTLRAVALDPDGDLVGCTDILVPAAPSVDVHQGGTLVLTAHRGHRLGTALKVANLRALLRVHPERRVIHTYTAPENGPMNAVNQVMGFRPVEENAEWQFAL